MIATWTPWLLKIFPSIGKLFSLLGFMHGEAAGFLALGKLGTSEHFATHPELSAAPAE